MTFEQIVQWGIPFASGAAGVYAGLKVGIARLEANYQNLKVRLDDVNNTLKSQVGEPRCREYRIDCREHINCRLDDIMDKLEKMEKTALDIALKVARIEKSME